MLHLVGSLKALPTRCSALIALPRKHRIRTKGETPIGNLNLLKITLVILYNKSWSIVKELIVILKVPIISRSGAINGDLSSQSTVKDEP